MSSSSSPPCKMRGKIADDGIYMSYPRDPAPVPCLRRDMLTRGYVLHRGLVESPSGIKVKIKHIFIEENFTMKKLIFGLVLCLSMAVVAQGGIPITVVNPGFEDPCYHKQINGFDGEIIDPGNSEFFPDVPGWEDDCTRDWPRSGVISPDHPTPSHSGSHRAFLYFDDTDAENVVWQLTDKTIAADEVYALKAWGLSGGVVPAGTVEELQLSFFYVDDGTGNHIEVASEVNFLPDDSPNWHACDAVFAANDDPCSIGKKLGIKFANLDVGCTAAGWLGFDDVRLEQLLAYNPDPCDGETPVAVNTNLNWTLDASVTNCDVYFGSDPNFINNPKVVDAQNVEFYNPPGDLVKDTTYYWRVDARVGTTLYEGDESDIWEFTTVAAEPQIEEDPCGLTVNAGETAVFRVKATNVDSYLWKRLGGAISGTVTESTLTISDVQKANEDVYWCELTKGTFTISTARVNLMTRRLVAIYEFEDSLDAKDDEEATCWPGFYTDPNTANDPPDPCYVTDPCSIDGGKALQFVADELHVRIADRETDVRKSKDFFNFYPQGYTVNAWVKTEQDADYGCMASKQNRGESHPTDSEGWVLNCTNTGTAAHGLRQVFGGSVVGTSNIADNEWHMVTGTYDAEAGVVAVYVDGKLETESAPSSDVASTNTYPVVLGAETVLAELAVYEGLLDKTSIYSYALSPVDVALLYTDVMGGNICVGGSPEYDFNDDCKVNILDFALFAADWLECNLVPDCLP